MTTPMESKVVLITGASSGIGAHVAQHLVTVGYRKLALVARTKHLLDEVAAKCRESGATDVLVLSKDLTIDDDCKSMIDEVIQHFGRLDIFICNAGGGHGKMQGVRDMAFEDFEYDLRLNLISPVLLTKHALPHLAKAGPGANILYVSSVAAMKPYHGGSAYCSAKAGLDHFAKVVALEEAPNGIRVNVLSPGVVMSGIHVKINLGKDMDECREKLKHLQPMGRVGEMEEISPIIAFLISEQNSFMTGSVVVSDGGLLVNSM